MQNIYRRTQRVINLAIASLLVAASPALASAAQDQDTSNLADNTLLVLLAPHTDRNNAKQILLNEAGATTLADMHVNRDDYSILWLQPAPGKREETFAKIVALQSSHRELQWLQRNHKARQSTSSTTGGGAAAGAPNDPTFSMQWPLANMRWTAARAKYMQYQRQPVHLTIMSTGFTPYNNQASSPELGLYAVQYDCTKPPNVTQEAPFTVSNSAEGDLDASITGALTNNGIGIAGSGCFNSNMPCYITMLRTSTDGSSTPEAYVQNAIVWSINNQSSRGGQGPISWSFANDYPGVPYWSQPVYQQLAQSLIAQKDMLIEAAGDRALSQPAIYRAPSYFGVIQATDINNNYLYTQVPGDQACAPGGQQPCYHDGTAYATGGSSASCPLWASAISMLIAFNPKLSAYQAHQIIIKTGTPVKDSLYSAVIPAWDKAIAAAIAAQ